MTRNAIVDALGVLKAGRIVDLTHLVHPGIQRFGPFPAMRTTRWPSRAFTSSRSRS